MYHDECDGLIITVGHKDQVSSSCLSLALLSSLPNYKCVQFRHPSSREQTNPPSPTGPRSACVSVEDLDDWWKVRLAEPQVNLRHYSCYQDQNAGVWTATGLKTVKPRRQTIWGYGEIPSG